MAQVVVELTGDEAKLLRSMQKVIEQNSKVKDSFSQAGKTGKDAGNNVANGLGAAGGVVEKVERSTFKLKAGLDSVAKTEFRELAGELATTITVMGGISKIIGESTKAWALYEAAQSKALGTQATLSDTNRRLVQVSDSPADLKAMQDRADAASKFTGVDRNVSREVLFSARSEGFEKEFEQVMGASPVIDPKAAAVVAGKLPALFQNKIGPIESMSLALRGAKESNLSFEQISTSLPTAAEGGALVGASPQELVATQAVLASRFKSGDTAADRIKAFASSAGIDPRLAGKGIVGAFEAIKAMPEDERADYLGKNQELNAAFVIIGEEMPKIQRQIAILEKERQDFAQGGGMLRNQIQLSKSDPGIQNQIEVNRDRIADEIETERNLATSAGRDERAGKTTSELLERKKGNLVNRWATWAADQALGVVGSDTDPDARAIIANVIGDTVAGKSGATTAKAFSDKVIETTQTKQAFDPRPSEKVESNQPPKPQERRVAVPSVAQVAAGLFSPTLIPLVPISKPKTVVEQKVPSKPVDAPKQVATKQDAALPIRNESQNVTVTVEKEKALQSQPVALPTRTERIPELSASSVTANLQQPVPIVQDESNRVSNTMVIPMSVPVATEQRPMVRDARVDEVRPQVVSPAGGQNQEALLREQNKILSDTQREIVKLAEAVVGSNQVPQAPNPALINAQLQSGAR